MTKKEAMELVQSDKNWMTCIPLSIGGAIICLEWCSYAESRGMLLD